MAVPLYMDHHVPKAITVGLRSRGVDVVTAYEDGTDQLDDDLLLKRAHELKRALFTQDDDLLEEAAKCQRDGSPFSGVIYGHQLRVTSGFFRPLYADRRRTFYSALFHHTPVHSGRMTSRSFWTRSASSAPKKNPAKSVASASDSKR